MYVCIYIYIYIYIYTHTCIDLPVAPDRPRLRRAALAVPRTLQATCMYVCMYIYIYIYIYT